MELDTSLRELPGVGRVRAGQLERLGLATAGDLVYYFPRSYEDRRGRSTIAEAEGQGPVCIPAMVAEPARVSRIRQGLELTKVRLVDDTGAMTAVFFNQSYVRQSLTPGDTFFFYGRVERSGGHRQIANPVFERQGQERFTGRIMPIYPLTAGVSNYLLASLALRCVPQCAGLIPEALPPDVRRACALAGSEFAYQNIHFPQDEHALALARRRLIFEELFYLSCGLAMLRQRRAGAQGPVCPTQDLDQFFALLPFAPTDAQRRAIREAAADLAGERPMNRLVQGDVGAGKTVVAAGCAWLAFRAGFQTALMAPTEILANQHYHTLSQLLAPAGIQVALLTGATPAAQKRKIHQALAQGAIHLVVGTHALISQGVEFQRLGLVVTDEQHRFGVDQRSALSAKGDSPNVLVMSATPIPRTLALIIYGDLDVSVMDQLPPGRTPVQTFVVGEDKRQRMYGFVRTLAGEGRQTYIVCPAVEENGREDCKAVTQYAQELAQGALAGLRVGLVHGRLKPREKQAVMAQFAGGELDVLVSTTVIEVGVDVPNAGLIIIENAERFGLSQLHQLRGRVGRGKHQSYCVLITNTRSVEAMQRLRTLASTTDGFKISEEDLKLRGPGDFFGSRQHGLPQMKLADLAGDMRLLSEAQDSARRLLMADPTLSQPENRPVLERVRTLFADTPDIFN